MGVGQRNLINIVVNGEQQGSDSIEPSQTVIKQVWAEVRELSSGSAFTGSQVATSRTYEFLIDVDTTIGIDLGMIIEWFNFIYKIVQIDRGERIQGRGKNYSFQVNQDGSYYRIVAESESYG